jgi:hypothetical protein
MEPKKHINLQSKYNHSAPKKQSLGKGKGIEVSKYNLLKNKWFLNILGCD